MGQSTVDDTVTGYLEGEHVWYASQLFARVVTTSTALKRDVSDSWLLRADDTAACCVSLMTANWTTLADVLISAHLRWSVLYSTGV